MIGFKIVGVLATVLGFILLLGIVVTLVTSKPVSNDNALVYINMAVTACALFLGAIAAFKAADTK